MLFFDVTFNTHLTAQSTHSVNITACMGASSLLNCQHPTQSCLRRGHLRLSFYSVLSYAGGALQTLIIVGETNLSWLDMYSGWYTSTP